MDIQDVTSTDINAPDRLLDSFSACLTAATARRIAAFRADTLTQARIAELAEKCTEGDLMPAERREYEDDVRTIDFISILQAKARLALARSREAS